MSLIGESTSIEDMRSAAKKTSAGRIFEKFGFNKVGDVEIRRFLSKEKVVANFLKEDVSVAITV